MNKYTFRCSLVLAVLVILGVLFYWYEIRPSRISINCAKKAETDAIYSYKFDNLNRIETIKSGYYTPESKNSQINKLRKEIDGKYRHFATVESFYKSCLKMNGIFK